MRRFLNRPVPYKLGGGSGQDDQLSDPEAAAPRRNEKNQNHKDSPSVFERPRTRSPRVLRGVFVI